MIRWNRPNLSVSLSLGLPSVSFLSGFRTKSSYAYLTFYLRDSRIKHITQIVVTGSHCRIHVLNFFWLIYCKTLYLTTAFIVRTNQTSEIQLMFPEDTPSCHCDWVTGITADAPVILVPYCKLSSTADWPEITYFRDLPLRVTTPSP